MCCLLGLQNCSKVRNTKQNAMQLAYDADDRLLAGMRTRSKRLRNNRGDDGLTPIVWLAHAAVSSRCSEETT